MANEFRVKNGLIIDEVSSGAGTITFSDGDVSTTGTMTITSTNNAANALYLRANAGTSETIKIHADQGSGAGSIELTSDAGGIDINAAAGAITIDSVGIALGAGSGELDLTTTGTLDVNANALDIDVTTAATIDAVGIALGAGSGELDLTTTGTMDINSAALDIDASGAVTIDGTAADSHIAITSAHTTGQAILLSANAHSGAILDMDAGILEIDTQKWMEFETTAATGHISFTSAHTAGMAFQINANAVGTSEVEINAGFLDVNVTAAATIDAVGIALGAGSGELDLTTTGTMDINSAALDIDASAALTITSTTMALDPSSTFDLDAAGAITIDGASITLGGDADTAFDIDTSTLDIDSSGAITIDGASTFSIDSVDDSNITVTADGKDLNIGVAGGGTQELNLTSAGTGTGVTVQASAGDLDLLAATAKDIKIQAGQINVISKDDAANAIKLLADQGSSETILISAVQGTDAASIKLNSTAGGITLDCELDIALDANGGDVFVKDNGTVYGSLTNSSNSLHIYSGTTASLKFGTNSANSNASFMGDLTVGGTTQTGSAANRFQVNSVSGSNETVEARIRTSIESPSVVSGVGNVLVLYNGNKSTVAAQGMVTTIGDGTAGDANTQSWFWGRMDSYNRYSLGYTVGKHWDHSTFAGSAASPEKAAQSVFQIDHEGKILIGATNAGIAGTIGPQNMLTVFITDSDAEDGMLFVRQDGTDVLSGELLGAIGFDSSDGAIPSLATEASAYIAAYATEAHAAGSKGGALVFGVTHLTDNADVASQEVMRVTSDSATSAFVQISNVDDSGGELRFVEDSDNDDASNVSQYAAFRAPSAITTSYTMILPAAQGTAGQVLDIASVSGTEITLAWDTAASGGVDISGTDHRVVRMSGTDDIQDTGITIDDSDNVSGMGTLGVGAITTTSNLAVTGTITGDTSLTLDAVTISTAEIGVLDGATQGTSSASKAMITDASGDILMPDSDKFELGASSDMTLYHDATNSYITNKTGALKIATETSGIAVAIGHTTSETTINDNLTVTGDLTVSGTTTTINTATIEIEDNILNLNRTQDTTDTATAATSGIEIYRGDGVNQASLIFDEADDTWDITNDLKINGTTASSSTSTGSLVIAGGAGIAADLYVGDDLRLRSNASVFAMGLDADDFSITHNGTTGATITATPLTITSATAATWSTSAGALTLTSAAAATWSTTAGILTLDGDDGIQISSTAAGNIDLDSFADIVLDVADDKHVFFQEAGVTHSAIAHGTVEITSLAGASAGATAIDTFDCTVYQAVKYLIVVEDIAADHYMTTEILVLGDDNGASAATAVMTTYAVLFNEAELGVFTVSGSGNNISLNYNPTDQTGTDLHRVRVVAQRIASLSDAGQ